MSNVVNSVEWTELPAPAEAGWLRVTVFRGHEPMDRWLVEPGMSIDCEVRQGANRLLIERAPSPSNPARVPGGSQP